MLNIKNVVESYNEFRTTGGALADLASRHWNGMRKEDIQELVRLHLYNRNNFRCSLIDEIPTDGAKMLDEFDSMTKARVDSLIVR
jgi:hypothetical protein